MLADSWIIRDRDTKAPIMETYDQRRVDALNTDKYEAVPAQQYLGEQSNTQQRGEQCSKT